MNIWVTLVLVCVGHISVGFGEICQRKFNNRWGPMPRATSEDDTLLVNYTRGTPTTIEKFPHQVAVIMNVEGSEFFCGGFIISEMSIVTAAHCVAGVSLPNIQVLAGSTFRKGGINVPLAEVIVHPEFSPFNFDNDVAVLNTKFPIGFSTVIQPIELPPLGRVVNERGKIVVSGWGKQEDGTFPDRLMMVNLPVVKRRRCRRSYPTVLTVNQFCAGNYFLGGEDTCEGDSGGAVVQDGLAIGIVSYGRGCGQPKSPGVNTDNAAKPIRSFIQEHTGI